MKKKADISFQVIVFAIIALLVLITLVIIFQKQIGQLFATLGNLVSQTSQTASQINITEMVK